MRLLLNLKRIRHVLKHTTKTWIAALMQLLLLLSIVAVSSMMTGCASGTLQTKVPPVPASLMTPCGILPLLGDPSMAGMLRNHIETTKRYYDCSARHNALGEFLKESR